MIRSMTGFGRLSDALSERLNATVTVKTVNHRFLEVSVRVPDSLWELESSIRALAAEAFSRGKVDISLRLQRTSEPDYTVRINSRVANAVIPEIRALLEEQGIQQSITGSDLMRVPDLLQVDTVDTEWEDSEHQALRELLRSVFDRVNEMRTSEGDGLRKDILERLATIDQGRVSLLERREAITAELMDSFRLRVAELARTAGIEVPEERVAQEIVMLAEKADVAEELTRLGLHLEQARKVIAGAEPAGKKLDFLSQEMLREINTLGQKSRSGDIRGLVVELKTEVERIREQVQNVE